MRAANFLTLFIVAILLFSLACQPVLAASEPLNFSGDYSTGSPTLTELWVDPVHGNNANSGAFDSPVRTLIEAWGRIPQGVTLTTGVRINLKPGNYPAVTSIPNYWEARYGTFAAPIFIQGAGTAPGQVVLQGNVNIYDVRYLYFDNLSIINTGDPFHCELCNHLLLRNMIFNGGAQNDAQEGVKVNQSQYVYIENSDISHAWDNAIDFVAVQYGHVIKNHIHDSGDWCEYAKGGSAYLRVEGNEFYNCGTGGFTAGQGTGFQFMTAPWIQYEAYDIKVVNNIIHDTDGAGLGVNGGYNILMAYNTLYRVGQRDHVIEVVFGQRSCDGDPANPEPVRANCQAYLDAGGWGTTVLDDGSNEIQIPNKNVYIYNNAVYNPAGYHSAWQHFAIYEPRANPASSHAPNPAVTDDNLQIRGNVIWNGSASMPLGIEDTPDACAAGNPTCNESQLRADNAINALQPQFVNPAGSEFHPTGDWVNTVATYAIPDFGWDLAGLPAGDASNAVPVDFAGTSRTATNPPGAYFNGINVITAPAYTSLAAQDGWVLESGEKSNKGGSFNSNATTFRLGDDAANRQYRAILHFDTSDLPDTAVITGVTLRIMKQSQAGTNPFGTHGALRADVRQAFFGPAAALAASDFQAGSGNTAVTSFGAAPAGKWYSAVLGGAAQVFINRTGSTQFRLRFTLDDNNDHGADYVTFYSGNAATANRPQLIVQYYVP